MYKAIPLNPQTFEVIAPEIGWSQTEVAEFYETNTYYDKYGYIVIEDRGNGALDFGFCTSEEFDQRYDFGQQFESQTEFVECYRV